MKLILEVSKYLLPLVISIVSILYTYKSNKKMERYKNELLLLQQRKTRLSENQKAILFVMQNTLTNAIIVGDTSTPNDIQTRIEKVINHSNNYREIFNPELFTNGVRALFSEIALSSTSEKVIALRLLFQENANSKVNDSKDLIDVKELTFIVYSMLYKYIYLDFTGNEIDDLYLLRLNIYNFKKSEDDYSNDKRMIIEFLENNYNWKNLKT